MHDAPPAPASPTAIEKWAPVAYFVVGQGAWFACVLSAARGIPWVGVLVTALLVAVHVLRVRRPREELKLVLCVLVIGGVWDSLLVRAGLLAYPNSTTLPGLAPLWIIALWASFAAQFNTTYQWLKSRLWVAALLGAIAGPMSFRAGAALGAVDFVKPWPAAAALAVGWAVMLPLIDLLSHRWDGVRRSAG
jgi:hypothetical protein